MNRIALLWFLVLVALAGCEQRTSPNSNTQGLPHLESVRKIVAGQLGKEPSQINDDATFGSLGADELDLVEIVMTTEDAHEVIISDEALVREAGAATANDLVQTLTVRKLANVLASVESRLESSE